MDAAKKDEPQPSQVTELHLLNLCKLFHCTPSQVLDEDAALITRMIVLNNADSAVRKIRRAKGNEIHNIDQGTGRMIQYLIDEGYNIGLN